MTKEEKKEVECFCCETIILKENSKYNSKDDCYVCLDCLCDEEDT